LIGQVSWARDIVCAWKDVSSLSDTSQSKLHGSTALVSLRDGTEYRFIWLGASSKLVTQLALSPRGQQSETKTDKQAVKADKRDADDDSGDEDGDADADSDDEREIAIADAAPTKRVRAIEQIEEIWRDSQVRVLFYGFVRVICRARIQAFSRAQAMSECQLPLGAPGSALTAHRELLNLRDRQVRACAARVRVQLVCVRV
jgi:hypothetical protein